MNIEVRDGIPNDYILHVGDIVESQAGYFYIVFPKFDADNKRGYLLRDISSDTGIHGIRKTLEDLTHKVTQEEQTIYSKDEYRLVLERK